MLDKKTIENLRKDLKFSDPTIFEKTVRVFSLLESLLEFYPDLIFKGGTSILFYQFPPARLSIDIDILLHEKDWVGLLGNLEAIVESSGVFKSVEEDERESAMPKAHYKFRYDPFLNLSSNRRRDY